MLEKINGFIWGNGMIFLLLAVGVIYTLKLNFIQFKTIPYIIKNLNDKKLRISQTKTICMSLGAAMGTGNIVGVASALSIGGAGAVFWMWISAFLGMAVVYAENTLSALFSDRDIKGPMAYLKKGLGSSRLANIFAFCCLMASFGMGGMAQTNSMSESIRKCVDIAPILIAVVLFTAIYTVIRGGAGRIENTAQILLPIATLLFSVICIIAIIKSERTIADVFSEIIHDAFGINQTLGGISGYGVSRAVSAGIRRGVFSNEAGLGSSPILHSASQNYASADLQGVSAMFEVFIDTFICCTLTALTILCSSSDGSISTALLSVTGYWTNTVIAALMTVFAFCTVIGWYYCGETAFTHLFGKNQKKIFSLVFAVSASFGAVISTEKVWLLSDIFNGAMAFPNLVGVILLINKVSGIKHISSANK